MSHHFQSFFFNDTATTEIYTLSLHDALPISDLAAFNLVLVVANEHEGTVHQTPLDRKSTRLNSSHANISYAVFCLKKKNKPENYEQRSMSGRVITAGTWAT